MKIIVQKSIGIGDSLETYVEKKMSPLAKFITHLEEGGEAELRLEIGRTSKHHKKGEVFKATADLHLPKKTLRAEEYAEDIRTAIDNARNTLRLEIAKYKTRFVDLDRKQLSKKQLGK